MKSLFLFSLFSLLITATMAAQDQNASAGKSASALPYHEIPAYPEDYSSGNVAARVVDGLGYRYYWATEGLTEKDLEYKPSEDGRTTEQTLDHLYGLSITIANAARQEPNIRPADRPTLSFEEKRRKTLENIQTASNILKGSLEKDIKDYNIVFKRGENVSEFPFWNLLNGPIADAIYHVGQIVSFRRSAGNPMHPGVNVFIGKTRER